MIRSAWKLWAGAATLMLGLAACAQEKAKSVPVVQDKTFTVTPATASLKAAFLTGQLQGLQVTERVEQGTGKVVDLPKLRATLKLKNDSQDRTARLVSGKIEYLDAEGKPIPLAEGRADTSFKFSSYTLDRLDPGMETSQDIEVPFPAAALKAGNLHNLRVKLFYIPSAYTEESVDIPASLRE